MFITDSVQVENGADYTFVCKKIPFAITCSQDYPNYGCNLIDLDLVNKMKLHLRNIKVCRMEILGQNVRSVGTIKQTLQCVKDGKTVGTIHLTAKVVRDLSTYFNVDCLASPNTYSRLTGRDAAVKENQFSCDSDIPHLGGDENESDDNKRGPVLGDGSDDEDSVSEDEEVPKLNYLRNPSGYPVYQPDPEPDPYQIYQDDLNFEDHDDPNKLPPGTYQVCQTHDWINCRRCPPVNAEPSPSAADYKVHSENVCKLCYMENLPPEVYKSHPMLHPRCPSMSDVDKRRLFGKSWRNFT